MLYINLRFTYLLYFTYLVNSVVVIFSVVSDCYVARPSDDHTYAHCTTSIERRSSAPLPQHSSLFRQSTTSPSTRHPRTL